MRLRERIGNRRTSAIRIRGIVVPVVRHSQNEGMDVADRVLDLRALLCQSNGNTLAS